jgi:hypothetical protein
MVVGGILALVAGGFYWQTRSQATAAQQQDSLAANTTTMGDSLWLEARGKADLARQNALSAGVKPAALTSGDSLRGLAESLAATGQKAEGAVLLTQAVTAWQSVEATARPPSTYTSALSHRLSGRDDPGAGASGIPAQSAGRHRAACGN